MDCNTERSFKTVPLHNGGKDELVVIVLGLMKCMIADYGRSYSVYTNVTYIYFWIKYPKRCL